MSESSTNRNAVTATWLSLLAETSLHPGSGRELGVVDLPVAREGGTGYPILFGSQLKGSLRDWAERSGTELERDHVFGKPDAAGAVLVSDARVVLLPVRSMTSSYRWVTCPHVLERLHRDLSRCGSSLSFKVPSVDEAKHALSNRPAPGRKLFLEEREVKVVDGVPEDVTGALQTFLGSGKTADRMLDQLTVVHDDTFAWFSRYGLPVRARNRLKEVTKQSIGLWYEESLPTDTLLVSVLSGRGNQHPADVLQALFGTEGGFLQVGGNETVGEGWVTVRWGPVAATKPGGG